MSFFRVPFVAIGERLGMRTVIFSIVIGAATLALPALAQTTTAPGAGSTTSPPSSATPGTMPPAVQTRPTDPLATGTSPGRRPVAPSAISPASRDEIMKRKSDAIDAKVKRGICQGC